MSEKHVRLEAVTVAKWFHKEFYKGTLKKGTHGKINRKFLIICSCCTVAIIQLFKNIISTVQAQWQQQP